LRGTTDERLAAIIGGLASVVFGVLALAWPDVTVLVVAVVFGARLVWFGLTHVARAFRRGASAQPPSRPRGRLRRWTRVVGTAVALVVALVLASVSVALRRGEPVVDAFYDTPSDVPTEPGMLLRSEPFSRAIPDGATAWRILYTTTRGDDVPAVASGIVVLPETAGPHTVIAWAHGTTGVDRACAPSVLEDPFGAGAFFLLGDVVDRGWALVATDYVGLGTEGGHPYLVGQPAGRSVLDAVRAARQLPEADLADETVVWGHSQGGGAALWTGVLASTYAPELDVLGVAALAPAADLVGLTGNLGGPGGSIFASYVLAGYSGTYPDVRVGDYVRPTARSVFEATVRRCLAEPAVLVSVIAAVTTGSAAFSADLASGALLRRLEENVPTGPIDAPLLIAQGAADSLVLPEVQTAYVKARCAAGQAVDYRVYDGLGHVPLVEADSALVPELLAWTEHRLDGAAATPTCD
jgi:hypothetical protein